MGNFFKNNDFKTDYKKRPNDEYKHLYNQLDEETKKKFARQRSFVLVGVVIVVLALIIILAVTGIGTNKAESIGNVLGGTDKVIVNLLGDHNSGENTYAKALEKALEERTQADIQLQDYEENGISRNTSYKRMDVKGDIVIIRLTLENYQSGEDAEGILEANVDGVANQGSLVFLVNYPSASFAEDTQSIRQANQNIAKVAKEKKILLLDAETYFNHLIESGSAEEELFQKDGMHLSEDGYQILGQFVADGLIKEAGLD